MHNKIDMKKLFFIILLGISNSLCGQYKAIDTTSFGYKNYVVHLGKEFSLNVNRLAKKYSFDANELLAIIHTESLFNPSAFNVNWYIVQSGGHYTASGDGGVGLLQFSNEWIKGYHNYQVSCMSRVRQLWIIDKMFKRIVDEGHGALLSSPGGLCLFIFGSHRGSASNQIAYLRNPYLGHGGAMYFTSMSTSFNAGKVIPYKKEKGNFETYYDFYMAIERNHYRKMYKHGKSLNKSN